MAWRSGSGGGYLARPPGYQVGVVIRPPAWQDRRGQLRGAGEPGRLAHAAKLAQKLRISRRAVDRLTRLRSRTTDGIVRHGLTEPTA